MVDADAQLSHARGRYSGKDAVPGGVPSAVVDGLEGIDIEHREAQPVAIAANALEFLRGRLQQGAPGPRARQRVGICAFAQLQRQRCAEGDLFLQRGLALLEFVDVDREAGDRPAGRCELADAQPSQAGIFAVHGDAVGFTLPSQPLGHVRGNRLGRQRCFGRDAQDVGVLQSTLVTL